MSFLCQNISVENSDNDSVSVPRQNRLQSRRRRMQNSNRIQSVNYNSASDSTNIINRSRALAYYDQFPLPTIEDDLQAIAVISNPSVPSDSLEQPASVHSSTENPTNRTSEESDEIPEEVIIRITPYSQPPYDPLTDENLSDDDREYLDSLGHYEWEDRFEVRGLAEMEIEKLEKYEFDAMNHQKYQTDCKICFDDFESGNLIKILRCKHEFHAKCVDVWLQSHRNCPLCRQNAVSS